MIKCHLSKIMGERRISIAELARETGLGRNTISRLYNETFKQIDKEALDKICAYLDCEVGQLLEHKEE